MKKEEANETRLTLIGVILNLSDEEVSNVSLSFDSDPDATTESHEGGHPGGPPPPPPDEDEG